MSAADDPVEPDRIGHCKCLVAFVAADAPHAVEPASILADLREFLKQKLPDYMLPQRIVMLDGLPRTPNGKIDLQTLLAEAAAAARRGG